MGDTVWYPLFFLYFCGMKEMEEQFIALLRAEVKPAVGCTEPVAVALAVARCCDELRGVGCREVERVRVDVSRNILKNAMGVGIPGTGGMIGLPVAVAVAVVCGRSEYGLEVLRDVDADFMVVAQGMVVDGCIEVRLTEESENVLYIKAVVFDKEGHSAEAVIEGSHDSFRSVVVDGVEVYRGNDVGVEGCCDGMVVDSEVLFKPSVREIFEFCTTVGVDKIAFMEEAGRLNLAIAQEGLSGSFGLQVGRTLMDEEHTGVFGGGLLNLAMGLTAAASDARMAGSTLSVMSNSGSGNQGLTATLPVVAAAQQYGATTEQLVRALTLSHLVAIHIKQSLGRLSALCGCVVASTGSSCGIVLLRGGGFEQIECAIKNMIGNITGMVCDGAKVGCALKVASGVSAAVQSAVLALGNISTTSRDGIIDHCLEQTLANLANIGCRGMEYTDKLMLEIMSSKSTPR